MWCIYMLLNYSMTDYKSISALRSLPGYVLIFIQFTDIYDWYVDNINIFIEVPFIKIADLFHWG